MSQSKAPSLPWSTTFQSSDLRPDWIPRISGMISVLGTPTCVRKLPCGTHLPPQVSWPLQGSSTQVAAIDRICDSSQSSCLWAFSSSLSLSFCASAVFPGGRISTSGSGLLRSAPDSAGRLLPHQAPCRLLRAKTIQNAFPSCT